MLKFSESEMVIVRGVKKEWFEENIVDMRVLFGGQELGQYQTF